MLSKEGPNAALGDVNGDGLNDVYIGGAAGQAGQLYLQTKTGFIKKTEDVFEKFANQEDVAVLFFDADEDGDLDLYIGSGGNNVPPHNKKLNHRLYLNDGKGNFQVSQYAFPDNDMNISVAVANDFDGDGDLDLFVGSRSVPYSYGNVPKSYLFKNNGHGQFTDVAPEMNNGIAQAGMVTGAVWADIFGNSNKELVITGEWMAPRIFTYQVNHFEELKTNLSNLFGMWQSVATSDINGDGKQDLVLGNIGENFSLHPDKQHPVKLWIDDFDRNGSIDKIITKTINQKDVPVFLKRDVTEQITALKKQNLNYASYATKSIQQLFTPDILKEADQKTFNYTSSCVAYNKSDGNFDIQRLPDYVQFSSVAAILCTDINADGKTDLVLGGNKFDFLPQFSRLDASFGHVLINRGRGDFEYLENALSGLEIRGEIRDIKAISGKNTNRILFLQNNDFPLLYEVSKTNRITN
jgi:hypothetical protein